MRRWLVIFLALSAAILSFDALRAYAIDGQPLTDGVIPQTTVAPRGWLAMLWALVIDGMAAAGILGVRDDRRDWRAWAMFVLAIGASLGFQVFALPPIVARAVPPIALALAIIVLELPRTRFPTVIAGSGGKTVETPEHPPVPAASATAAATEAGPIPVPPRPHPVATLPNKDLVALRRAFQTGGAELVEQVRARRDIDPGLVPARWNGQHYE